MWYQYFSFIGGDDVMRTHFQLDQRGNLTLTTAFDRENLSNPIINMIIWATPRCFEQIDMNIRPNIYPPTDYGRNRTLLWVEVGFCLNLVKLTQDIHITFLVVAAMVAAGV